MLRYASPIALALTLAAGVAFAGAGQMSSGRPSAVLTPEQCDAVWSKAVTSGDSLSKTDSTATTYVANWAQADANNDGKLSKDEFQAGCTKGLIKNPDQK